jgi:hypothetical protein
MVGKHPGQELVEPFGPIDDESHAPTVPVLELSHPGAKVVKA